MVRKAGRLMKTNTQQLTIALLFKAITCINSNKILQLPALMVFTC